jgi:hypothetical protein
MFCHYIDFNVKLLFILSILAILWSLTETIIYHTYIYNTLANITQSNPNNITLYITDIKCSNLNVNNECYIPCHNYQIFQLYNIWCDCLSNICSLNKDIIIYKYMNRQYAGWILSGILLISVIFSIIYNYAVSIINSLAIVI